MVRRNITKYASITALALTVVSQESDAATIDFMYIIGGDTSWTTTAGTTYRGIAYDAALVSTQTHFLGSIWDTSHHVSGNKIGGDAYDGYGYLSGRPNHSASQAYASPFNGLSGARYTSAVATGEAHAPLAFRWFDSFTNNTNQDISAIIRFSGNLGSDGRNTLLSHAAPGYVIMADSTTFGTPDETIVQIYSDANYASNVAVYASAGDDNVYFDYTLNVAPGQTASTLVFNYLVVDPDRVTDPTAALQREIELGKILATSFINSPIFTGLTADQIASIVNFNVSLDGSLPAAASSSRLAGNALHLFNNLLDSNRSFTNAGANLINESVRPHSYAPSIGNDRSEAAAQIASLLGQSGGSARHGNDYSELFMLGGYSRGSDRSLSETLKYDGYALAIGYQFSPDSRNQYGLVAGYINTSGEIENSYHDISGEQFIISPYARWALPNEIKLDARMSLSADNWSYNRNAGALDAQASYDGYSIGASLQASKAFETNIATISPFAKISLLHSHFNAYEEKNAGSGNLDVPSYSVNAIEALAGIGLSDHWQLDNDQTITGFANIGIGKGFGTDRSITTSYLGSSLHYATLIEGNDDMFARLDIGASLQMNEQTSLMMSYSGNYTSDSDQHSISSKLVVKF